VSSCVEDSNPDFFCNPNADTGAQSDPVCMWKKYAVMGVRVRTEDSLVKAMKDAGSPYYQGN